MNRRVARLLLVSLSLIFIILLTPNPGFTGAENPCGGTGFVLPPYLGNVTVKWVPNCYAGSGCVFGYGVLRGVERGQRDIIIRERDPILVLTELDQVSFLSLEPVNLLFLQFGISFNWEGRCFGISSAGDLDYKTDTRFTVDVVVMEVQ